MGIPKVDEATTIALEAIRDAAPGLLTMTEAAEKVASAAGVSIGTARNRLRAAVEAGGLLELKPWSRKFVIELPGEKTAGVGPFYIAQEWTGTGREHRKVITTDDSKMSPSSYGPGNTTYVADPEQIREYVQQLSDEKKAKETADREAAQAEKKAQTKEIGRRFPGLLRNLRRFRLLGTEIREHRGRFASVKTSTHLEDEDRHGKEGLAIEERDASVTIYAWGNENVALLNSILKAGIAAHIESRPLSLCAHCGDRILQVPQGEDGGFWWHIDSTKAACAEGDTKAEPAEEN
jgi:plasmid stabilization system protein ParE